MQFVQTVHQAWQMGLRRLRVRPNFWITATSDGRMLFDVAITLPHTERNILLAAADTPHIREEQIDEVERFLSTEVDSVDGTDVDEAEGFLCALIQNTLAVSVPSDPRWNKSEITLQICETVDGSIRSLKVPHASEPNHMIEHAVFIGRITFRADVLIPTSTNPLPNMGFVTRFIADNDWPGLAQAIRHCAAADRSARIAELASSIAIINGYSEERNLIKINQLNSGNKRQIFSFCAPEDTIYLSTDFEKGAFEVCNKSGVHLGEWLFSGKKHCDADSSGAHNIIVES